MSNPALGPILPFLRAARDARTMSLMGITISVLIGSADSDVLTVSEYTAEAGAPGPVLHWHKESTEWFYVLEGEFTFEISGEAKVAKPGTLTHVPPRTLHRFWNSAASRSRFIFGFNRGGMDGYFAELFDFVKSQQVWPPKDLSRLEQIAERYDTFSPAKL